MSECVYCYWIERGITEIPKREKEHWVDEELGFKLCKKHLEECMECSFCGSQDTTPKSGISKTGKNAGKPWKAYDCNEPQCKNDKGYPNRTFVPMGRPKALNGNPTGNNEFTTINKKLDLIITHLGIKPEKAVTIEKDQTPF